MPALSRRRLVVLAASLSLVLSACGGTTASPTIPADATGSVVPAVTATPSLVAAFPVSLTDDEDTAVEIAAEPARIVSLTPANTELLFELGAGDRVVATDSGSDYPAEAVPLPDVADFGSVDVEKIVGLEADLVLAGGLGFTPPEAVAQLRDLGIPVVVVYAPTVEAVDEDIELIGTAIGAAEAARELADGMRVEMDAIAAAVANDARPRVFYEIGYTDATGQIYAPADDSFVAEMVTMAGGDTVSTGDPASYEIPLETLIERDPEIIVLGVNPFYAPTPEQVAARPGWNVMTAVKDDAIVVVADTEITRPGPRLPIGLRNLAAAIRPDVSLPVAP
ncbi:MAG: ABC transporter substrate-binding protein [Candidatus Limnocylindrales bacterium]